MSKERTRERREEIARFTIRAIALRREKIPLLGEPPIAPHKIIDLLLKEDPGLAEWENHKTPLQRINVEVEREITKDKLRL